MKESIPFRPKKLSTFICVAFCSTPWVKQHRLNLCSFLQETTTHLATTKHQYIKQFELTKELLLISLTQLLEASTELVLFSHKFNPKLNIIALADVSLGLGRQEANKICPIDSEQLDLTGSCYLVPQLLTGRFRTLQFLVRLHARGSGPNCNDPGSPHCGLYQQQTHEHFIIKTQGSSKTPVLLYVCKRSSSLIWTTN